MATNLWTLAESIGMARPVADEASDWLVDKGFAQWVALGGEISLTRDGADRIEDAQRAPNEATSGMPPASVININGPMHGNIAQNNVNASVQANLAQSAVAPGPETSKESAWRAWRIEIIGGTIAAVLGGVILFAVLRDDGSSPANTGDASVAVKCGEERCVRLRVINTVTDGRDEGVFVRTAPLPGGQNRSGARQGSTIYGVCTADGEMVEGDAKWIKAPFLFVDGDIGPAGDFANPQSRSVPDGPEFGWISAHFLGPAEAVEGLPACPM